jgi:predicted Fe-Mo cluster-binding NifX family protein
MVMRKRESNRRRGRKTGMKIAVVTEDGESISQHFGRAPYYAVLTVDEGLVTEREMREKLGHRHFVGQDEHGVGTPHGFGSQARSRHDRMRQTIADCQVLLARGMGRGAHVSLEEAGIEVIVTDVAEIDEAVKQYLAGDLVDLSEQLLH